MARTGESLAVIYRLFAADDTLLYIGRTIDLHARFGEHRYKHWWKDVAYGTFEFASSPAATEWRAILTEKPVHNGTGQDTAPPPIPDDATPAERKRALNRERVRRYRLKQRELVREREAR